MIWLKITHPSKGFYVPSVLSTLFVLNIFYSLLSFLLTYQPCFFVFSFMMVDQRLQHNSVTYHIDLMLFIIICTVKKVYGGILASLFSIFYAVIVMHLLLCNYYYLLFIYYYYCHAVIIMTFYICHKSHNSSLLTLNSKLFLKIF